MFAIFSKEHTLLVLQGMMNFGFALLSTERKSKENVNISQIGLHILIKIAEKKSATILEILKHVIQNIVEGGTNVSQFTGTVCYVNAIFVQKINF